MRLLHVLNGLEVGGKERVVLDLAARGRTLGWDVRLLLFDTPFRNETHDFAPGAVPYRFIRRGPGLDCGFALKLSRYIRAEAFDVVHAHNDTALFYCAFAGLWSGRRRARTVATYHARPGHATRAARLLTRWATSRISRVTAVSDELARHLVASGWAARCDTVWNGVDLQTFAPGPDDGKWRSQLAIEPDALLVLHIGRHDAVKRHVDLLQTARLLTTHVPRLVFVLVGSGPLTPKIEAEARAIENVRVIARVLDVPSLLRAADVFVLCSDHEGAPRVLLEALATGCPVVTTDVGGCRSILTNRRGAICGVLVPPRSPQRLADAVLKLATDPGRRRVLADLGRERAADFSADVEWADYCSLWQGNAPRRQFDHDP